MPAIVVPRFKAVGLMVIEGNAPGLTAALNMTFCVVAPGLLTPMVPAKTPSPAAPAALIRAETVVVASVPLVGASVNVC